MIFYSDFKLLRITKWHFIFPILVGAFIVLFDYPQGFLSVKTMSFVVLYSLSLGIPFLKLNEYIEWKLEQYIPWLKKPFKRLVVSVLLELITIIVILLIVNFIYIILIRHQDITSFYLQTYKGLFYAIGITTAGIIIANSFLFFRSWRQSAINEEKIKREKLAFEYEALKNQVNPHFLFNNLTALTSLVYKDQKKAENFIRQFANVFRYTLEYSNKELVDLSTERNLIESIKYLYHIRHENELLITINLPDSKEKYIVPMALQMLLENAIKHNIISRDKPLKVEIEENGEYISVINNLQPKILMADSNKVGLKNIQERYKYLSDKEIIINKTDKWFTVKIPVLNQYENKSFNN